MSKDAIARARAAFKTEEHQQALQILEAALAQSPNDPDLNCEVAIVFCFLQREDEAANLLDRAVGAERFGELAQILNRYAHCRKLMAARLKVDDAKGRAIAEKVSKFAIEPVGECGIKLSACLIVKNEERHLERCLRSIANHVDEIVVVDTGSTDSTIEIARSFDAKIGFFKWCDDFSAARNESLRMATGNWVLWIDADEEVDPRSWTAIAEGLIRPQFGGYYVRILNLMDKEGRQQYVHTPVRIFQRLPEVHFEGRVHEQVLQCFDQLGMPSATLRNVTLNHYGYAPEDMQEKRKIDRTVGMLEREVDESPEDSFHWFNLANAYSVAKRPEDAVRAARKCIEFIHERNAFGSLAYQILASGLNATGRSEEALEATEASRKLNFFTILNQFERALALLQLARFDQALEAIDECLAMEWPEGLTGDYGIFRHKRHAIKGQILSELGRLEEALAYLEVSLGVDPQFAPANFAKGLTLERLGRVDEAIAFIEASSKHEDFAQPATKTLGRIALQQGDFRKAAACFKQAWEARPSELDCWVAWTQILEQAGTPADAIEAYEAYARVKEPNCELLINWGRALAETGDNDGALRRYGEAIEQDPANPNSYFNTGDLLYRLGAYVDSAEAYEFGLRLQPDNAEGWFVLGNAFAQMGVLDGARTAYRQTLTLQPSHQKAQYNLALVSTEAEAAA
ncbi:MAG: tetratricopeptide repeat protein [Armatimonadetes bacterium]|nr:tetratricopeptide repeat protein [Armatimonadota bacterium]